MKVTRIHGSAKFTGPHSVEVEGKEYHAKHILIATGGAPNKLGESRKSEKLSPITVISRNKGKLVH